MKKQTPFRKRFIAITLTALCIVVVLFLAGFYKFSLVAGHIYDAEALFKTLRLGDSLPGLDRLLHSRAHAATPKKELQPKLDQEAETAPRAPAPPAPNLANSDGTSPLPPVTSDRPSPWSIPWTLPAKQTGVETYLLLGVDSRAGERARADTIMLATVPNNGGKIHLLSIPRDTYVAVAGHGYTKINHAMSYGGVPLMKRTVNQFLQVPIDHTVVVDFAGFRQVIDEMGGLDLKVEKNMDYDDPTDDTHIHLRQGQRLQSGKEALDYARFRHDAEADTGRMRRQQQVIRAMMQKGTKPQNWGRMFRLLDIVGDHVKTDVPAAQIGRLVLNYANEGRDSVQTMQLAGTNKISRKDQLWYFYVKEADRQRISRTLQELKRGNE